VILITIYAYPVDINISVLILEVLRHRAVHHLATCWAVGVDLVYPRSSRDFQGGGNLLLGSVGVSSGANDTAAVARHCLKTSAHARPLVYVGSKIVSVDVYFTVVRNKRGLIGVTSIKVNWESEGWNPSRECGEWGRECARELRLSEALIAQVVGDAGSADILEFLPFRLFHVALVCEVLQLLAQALVAVRIVTHVTRSGRQSRNAIWLRSIKWLGRWIRNRGLVGWARSRWNQRWATSG